MLVELRKSSIEFHQSVQGQFKDICSPLHDLGIKDYYCFQSLENGSNLLHCSHAHAAMEHYSTFLRQDEFYTNVLESSSPTAKQCFVTGDVERFDSKKDFILHKLWHHNVWNILTISRIKEDKTAQVWGFSMGRDFQDPLSFFASRIDLIKRFIAYFDIVGSDLIDMLNKKRLISFDQKFTFHKKGPDVELAKTTINFLRKTSLKNLSLEHEGRILEVTKRQGQCLYFLALNYSVKEIGKILDISPRTVDVFLQAVKGKMRASSKRELVNMVHNKNWKETLSLLT